MSHSKLINKMNKQTKPTCACAIVARAVEFGTNIPSDLFCYLIHHYHNESPSNRISGLFWKGSWTMDRKIKTRKMEEIMEKHTIQREIHCWDHLGQEELQMLLDSGTRTGPFEMTQWCPFNQPIFEFANTVFLKGLYIRKPHLTMWP